MARQGTSAAPAALRIREDRAIGRALRIMERRAAEHGQSFENPEVSARFFRLRLAGELREHFEVAFLNSGHRLICCERLFSGGLSVAEVHPRIVAQRALAVNAGAVVVAHNHPSGNPTPSASDRAVTARLKRALDLIDVSLLDHVVVGAQGVASMAELRLL